MKQLRPDSLTPAVFQLVTEREVPFLPLSRSRPSHKPFSGGATRCFLLALSLSYSLTLSLSLSLSLTLSLLLSLTLSYSLLLSLSLSLTRTVTLTLTLLHSLSLCLPLSSFFPRCVQHATPSTHATQSTCSTNHGSIIISISIIHSSSSGVFTQACVTAWCPTRRHLPTTVWSVGAENMVSAMVWPVRETDESAPDVVGDGRVSHPMVPAYGGCGGRR